MESLYRCSKIDILKREQENFKLNEEGIIVEHQIKNFTFTCKGKERRLPDVLIIGAPKAGTSALLTFLRSNKNIVAPLNELHFFNKDQNYNQIQSFVP
uniref:Sulfotransferase n=1 Tax=Acrobeloides nanus TaxID=290746 RepID=A0A914EG11_9BILA